MRFKNVVTVAKTLYYSDLEGLPLSHVVPFDSLDARYMLRYMATAERVIDELEALV